MSQQLQQPHKSRLKYSSQASECNTEEKSFNPDKTMHSQKDQIKKG
jgi:hypothetical protein